MRTWRTFHPEWDYTLWTESNRPTLRNERAFVAAPSYALKADLLRYELLLDHGGMYVDADFECHRPLDPLIDKKSLVLVSEFGIVCNSIMAVEKDDPFVSLLVEESSRRFFESSGGARLQPHLLTGPYMVDEVFVREGFAQSRPDSLLPGDYFFPPRTRVTSALERAAEKRYATHHGLATWQRNRTLGARVRRTKLRTRLRRFVDLSAE